RDVSFFRVFNSNMDPEELFRANLAVVHRVAREVSRGARLPPSEMDDFVSSVMVSLMEHDYAVLRKWEGRSSLAGYLIVVHRRLLANRRDHDLGRWHPSAEASRQGEAGVLLEKLLLRDHRSLDEALPLVLRADPSLTREDVLAMASRFPARAQR